MMIITCICHHYNIRILAVMPTKECLTKRWRSFAIMPESTAMWPVGGGDIFVIQQMRICDGINSHVSGRLEDGGDIPTSDEFTLCEILHLAGAWTSTSSRPWRQRSLFLTECLWRTGAGVDFSSILHHLQVPELFNNC